MSSILIVSLLRDYEVKDVKIHTFKLKHEDNEEKETFDIEKSDGTTVEMLFLTILSFQMMSTRMTFTGPLSYSYFDKCLTDNALEEWRSVTPHQDDQTIENFKYSQEEWLTSLLPDNAFVSQKEWMANIMCNPPKGFPVWIDGYHDSVYDYLLRLLYSYCDTTYSMKNCSCF